MPPSFPYVVKLTKLLFITYFLFKNILLNAKYAHEQKKKKSKEILK